MTTSQYLPSDISFTHVADLYLSELRTGTAPSIEALANAFPHLSNEIRNQLPALALLEKAMGKPEAKVAFNAEDDLGGCEIIREVGRGAVGIVYEALQKDIGRKVAIKVISLAGNTNPISVDRFELERQAMGRVEHPHIVPVYSYGHNAQHAYLVMRLIDGHSLYDLQNGGGNFRTQAQMNELQANWKALAQLGRDIASGLHHAHQQGLVHRDVKPANLLLDVDGKCWISDFGLAKVYDYLRSISRTGDAIGTPRYMAPEQLRGVCDARSDVYALGITLYELAAGQKVWGDVSNFSLVTNRGSISLENIADLRPDLPAPLCKIIMKACQFSPEDRYQSAEELRIVIDRLLAGATVGDRRKRKRESDEVFRSKSRRNMIIASLAISGVCSLIGTIYVVASRPYPAATGSGIPPTHAAIDSSNAHMSAINLIDKLADEKQGDMVEIVKTFVGDALGQTGDDLNFSDPAKVEIKQQVDHLAHTIKNGGLTEQSLKKFLEGYRETSLPIATKIMRVSVILQKSPTLSIQEKQHAIGMLQFLAGSVINGQLQSNEAIAMVNGLTGGQANSVAEMSALNIPDNALRGWLAAVHRRLATLPPPDRSNPAVAEQLQQVFEGAFGKAE